MNESSPDNVNYEDQSAYDVADMVKQFFRDLPEPLLTSKLGETFLHIYQCKDKHLFVVFILLPHLVLFYFGAHCEIATWVHVAVWGCNFKSSKWPLTVHDCFSLFYQRVCKAEKIEIDSLKCADVPKDQRLQAVQAAIMLMSDENREVLQTLLCFLSDVTSSVEENQMTPMNIAVCLAPSLFHLNILKKDNLSPRYIFFSCLLVLQLPSTLPKLMNRTRMHSINSCMIIFTYDSIKIDIKWVTEFAPPSGVQ